MIIIIMVMTEEEDDEEDENGGGEYKIKNKNSSCIISTQFKKRKQDKFIV